jgi:phosphatidylserine/phosphatidylglycerophosphate/cardiolipin synthase-like enzyme
MHDIALSIMRPLSKGVNISDRGDDDSSLVEPAAPMHLKGYQIEGGLLRTGAANFSTSRLKLQDNNLIVIESAEAAAAFMRALEARYVRGEAFDLRQQSSP